MHYAQETNYFQTYEITKSYLKTLINNILRDTIQDARLIKCVHIYIIYILCVLFKLYRDV